MQLYSIGVGKVSFTKNRHNHELQNILSGIVNQKQGNLIQTVSQKLSAGKKPGSTFEKDDFTKQHEKGLIEFAETNNLWINDIDENSFLSEGAEQRVYLCADGIHVYKLNDTIFYTSRADYFLSLQLHNFFFPGTFYKLTDLQEKKTCYMLLYSSLS